MTDISKNSARKKWGPKASKRFIRFPIELLYHYMEIGLTTDDLPIILWIDFYQWGEKAAFPHPSKMAYVFHISYEEAVKRLKDLAARDFLVLEKTQSNPTNYHQDLRPTRNRLRKFLNDNPNHCVWLSETDPKRIDVSKIKDNKVDTSNSKDTSILRNSSQKNNPENVKDILHKKRPV